MSTADWYAGKTQSIFEKYATGSARVHYHLGFTSAEDEGLPLRERMHASQERLLAQSFEHWGAQLHGRALDVGCGLGGTSLWLAEHFDVDVTALTNVEAHAGIVNDRARSCGVSQRVHTVVGLAERMPCEGVYDTVVCFEAANLFDRDRWLTSLEPHVRAGTRLLIDDYFVHGAQLKAEFDAAFAADIGTVLSYIALAESHGWLLDRALDVSARSAQFWRWCAEYAERESHRGWHQSAAFHQRMYEAQVRGAYRHALLAFVKGA